MALKKCNDCGGSISTSTRVCPHCGSTYQGGGCALVVFVAVIVLGWLVGYSVYLQVMK